MDFALGIRFRNSPCKQLDSFADHFKESMVESPQRTSLDMNRVHYVPYMSVTGFEIELLKRFEGSPEVVETS